MNVSLLEGKITRSLILFAIPILFSLVLQTLYNTVDTVLVGHFLGDAPLAAMGATAALFDLIVGFCTGCGNGFAIIAGQSFGAQNMKRLKQCMASSIVLSLVIAVVLSAAAWLSLPALLHLLETPEEIFVDALTYIRLIVLGMIITVYYNLCAGMLRAIGDSTTPLVILAISSAFNVVLDMFCILVLHMGVAGAAYATLAAQLISTIICVIWIFKKKQLLVPDAKDFRLEPALTKELLLQGSSMGFMGSIVAIGSVILQSGINKQGMLVIAGHTAARRVYMITNMPNIALMQSVVNFVSQNTGARQFERVIQGVRDANRLSVYYAVIITIFTYLTSNLLVALISGSSSEVVLSNGSLYLRVNTPFYFVLGILLNLRCSLQGLGCKTIPLFSSVIELVGKILFTILIIPKTGYLGVIWCEPIIWCAMMLFLAWNYKRLPLLVDKGYKPVIV